MKRIMVTGVGRGLGRAVAEKYVAQGHRVWGSTRSGTSDLPLAGCVAIDLASEDSIISGVDALAVEIDGIDLLVNCAGTDSRSFGAASRQERALFAVNADQINGLMAVNLTGPMVVTRAALPLLRNGENPMVLNFSSQLGSMEFARSGGGDGAYCISKAALNMFGVQAAASLRPEGIGVVSLHPGWVQTDMGGPSATMTVDESATAIVATSLGLTLADSGRFIRWDGTDHPW